MNETHLGNIGATIARIDMANLRYTYKQRLLAELRSKPIEEILGAKPIENPKEPEE